MGKEPMLWREISTEIETDGRTLVPREKKLRKSERRKSSRVLFEYVSSRHIGLFTLNNPYLRGQGSRSKRGANDKIKRIHLSLRFRLENSYKHEFGPLMNATARGYYNAAEILTISRKRRVVCQTIFLSNTRGLNPSS